MQNRSHLISLLFATLLTALPGFTQPAEYIGTITKEPWKPGTTPPTLVSLSGFSGEVDSVIRFDLHVRGYKFVRPEEAEYQITGSNNGSVKGQVKARATGETILTRPYSGASLRRQAHAFTDDVVKATRGDQGIALTRIACKVDQGRNTEMYVADFDGYGATSVTSGDNTMAKSPVWVPGQPVLLYTSDINHHNIIIRHDITTKKRSKVAAYSGDNLMPAVSADGSKVAMVLSKSGWTDLYVANLDGSGLKQLTTSREEESSPCWSPDGRWICFATKIGARRTLAKISPNGGTVQRLNVGLANPTEPDWSPDGKWIAFTAQMGGFELGVVPADGDGGAATVLVSGEDPSWAPDSRTLAFTRRAGSRNTLSLLDVPTKQFKDVPRISGSNNSQPAWAR